MNTHATAEKHWARAALDSLVVEKKFWLRSLEVTLLGTSALAFCPHPGLPPVLHEALTLRIDQLEFISLNRAGVGVVIRC